MVTLLLADDSVTIQRVIELTFADEGIRVVSVGDGASAIARINQECPDIVLADVGMAGVDGYEVALHVKRTPASAHVPVLLLTGAFEPIDEERARETGCDGVLVKPFEPRQLITTVRGLLSGARPADLWPADMPRLEPRAPKPAVVPAAAPVPPPAPVSPPKPAPILEPVPAPVPAFAVDLPPVSVPYEPESDPDLALALARLEFVGVPGEADVEDTPETLRPEPPGPMPGPAAAPTVAWDLTVGPSSIGAPRPAATSGSGSLATVFSALLAAERSNPQARAAALSGAALSEAAVEEVVQRVVRRMTDELVRKIVLETAERLIREEIDRIKS